MERPALSCRLTIRAFSWTRISATGWASFFPDSSMSFNRSSAYLSLAVPIRRFRAFVTAHQTQRSLIGARSMSGSSSPTITTSAAGACGWALTLVAVST